MMRFSTIILLLVTLLMCFVVESRLIYEYDDTDAERIHPQYVKRNRQCLLNAGLSQGCDLSDFINSRSLNNRLSSFAGPGK